MTTVAFSHVTKRFGPVTAVGDVSLEVRSGEFTTILGPSGSGKTTLLSLLAGILHPTSGSIFIGDREVTGLRAAERNIGLVFQQYALFPHMTVADNVAFPLRVRRRPSSEIRSRVDGALALVRLEGYGDRYPHELSGGQQQRVALARAVVFKPDILLLDEPLAALDRKLREEVRGEIHRLQRRLGITTLLVTHDQEEALSMSDRIVVLEGGRVQQIDAPGTAYYRPRSRFVAGFLGVANLVEGTLERKGDAAAIRLASGKAVACAASDVAGRSVCGLIRPEDVRLVNGSGVGMLSGTVREAVFLGESVRYVIDADDGLTLTAHVTGSRGRVAEGQTVKVEWDPARVWILPDTGDREL